MLQAINDRIKGWLGIVIVVLIGLPFALWGIQSYLDDSGPMYAAKVNGTEISSSTFERTVSMQRQSMLRQYGGNLPIEEKELRKSTLSQLVNQQLLENVTFDSGYRISDAILSQNIKQQFSVDGVFDRDRFEAGVMSLGMSAPMYENSLRNELRMKQMQSALANTSFVTGSEVSNLAALNEQTRDISVLTFNMEHFSTAEKPTAEEIKQYYETNTQRFMVSEKIKIDYIEIDSESLAENVVVDEAAVKKMYDDYVTSISGREERKAQHILLQASEDKEADKAKLESIKLEIENGASFSELAKKYSQDTGSAVEGGELGWVALGEMARPFEKMLFSMDKDSVSEVVETQFGYHLIKLNDVRSETVEPLGVKRYEFEDEIKKDSVASTFYDLSERLAAIAYENPDNLDAVVDELGIKVATSGSFSRDKGQGIAENEKVRSIAFSSLVLEEGSNSDVIEISPTRVAVVRLNEHLPAIAIPLDVVSSKIENILKSQKGRNQAKAAALAVKTKIESGESIDSQKSDGIKIETIKALGRSENAKVSAPSILHNAFEISPNQDGSPSLKVVDLVTGDVALLVLTKVNSPANISEDKLDLVKNEALRESITRDFSNALLSIKNNAEIDINQRVVEN
jgi:peptidyl-prolyl cis-trans isomerase D